MRKTIIQLIVGGIVACYSFPAFALVDPCQFTDNRPKYCEQQKSNANWFDFLTGLYSLTQMKYHEPTPQQSLLNMILAMESVKIEFPPPPLYMSSNAVSNPLTTTNSLILHTQDSQIVDERTAVEVANAEQARKAAQEGTTTTTLSDTERARIESSAMAAESNGYSSAISSAVGSGLCDTPNDLASASRCLFAASEKTDTLNDGQKMLLFASGAGDPAAKTLLTQGANGLFEQFHSADDVDDIKKIIETKKEVDELIKDVEKKYGNYKTTLNHGAEAIYALEDVKQSVVNGKLTDDSFARLADYFDAKEKFINSAKSIDDAGFGEYAKAEIDAAVESNKTLKTLKDKHLSIDKKIIDASDKLIGKAQELEDRYGSTYASQAMKNVGNNLSLLGSSSLGDKAQGVLNMQREIAAIAELAYSPNNQAEPVPTQTPKKDLSGVFNSAAMALAALTAVFGIELFAKRF